MACLWGTRIASNRYSNSFIPAAMRLLTVLSLQVAVIYGQCSLVQFLSLRSIVGLVDVVLIKTRLLPCFAFCLSVPFLNFSICFSLLTHMPLFRDPHPLIVCIRRNPNWPEEVKSFPHGYKGMTHASTSTQAHTKTLLFSNSFIHMK